MRVYLYFLYLVFAAIYIAGISFLIITIVQTWDKDILPTGLQLVGCIFSMVVLKMQTEGMIMYFKAKKWKKKKQ